MWGPLQLTLVNHREGAELGYQAGQLAYQESDMGLEVAMLWYLDMPRYRPRNLTPQIIEEWKAFFLLGWCSGLLETQEENNGQADTFVTQGRGHL